MFFSLGKFVRPDRSLLYHSSAVVLKCQGLGVEGRITGPSRLVGFSFVSF